MLRRPLDLIVRKEFDKLHAPTAFALSGLDEARSASGPTPAQPINSSFGAWAGWTPAIGLSDVLNGQADRLFKRRGVNIYRISFPPALRPYIGMTETYSIQMRVEKHAKGEGSVQVFNRLRSLGANLNAAKVQAGRLRRALTIRDAHMYEIWLQSREFAMDWGVIRDTRTFE